MDIYIWVCSRIYTYVYPKIRTASLPPSLISITTMGSAKHDIKNDLTVIYSYAQIIQKKGDEENKEFAQVIIKRVGEIGKKLDSLKEKSSHS